METSNITVHYQQISDCLKVTFTFEKFLNQKIINLLQKILVTSLKNFQA